MSTPPRLPEPLLDDDEAAAGPPADERLARIVQHPDGYHWIAPDGHQQFGPYATVEEALADMEADDSDTAVEPASLEETERSLGLADWIDPDTGALAEDTQTRIEDH